MPAHPTDIGGRIIFMTSAFVGVGPWFGFRIRAGGSARAQFRDFNDFHRFGGFRGERFQDFPKSSRTARFQGRSSVPWRSAQRFARRSTQQQLPRWNAQCAQRRLPAVSRPTVLPAAPCRAVASAVERPMPTRAVASVVELPNASPRSAAPSGSFRGGAPSLWQFPWGRRGP